MAIIRLRDQLQQDLDDLRTHRHIIRATVRCSRCGAIGPGRRPSISVRAMLLALRRFKIDTEDSVRQLERSWQKHRALHHLDLYGHPEGAEIADDHC